jgi:hypothetical protein
MIQSPLPLRLPLPLPKYTFIHFADSGLAADQLADDLARQDKDLLVEDFEEPLRNATLAIFYNNDILGNDLRKPEVRNRPLPDGIGNTNVDFMKHFETWLRLRYGSGILGWLAWQRLQQDIPAIRYLFRDARNPADILAIINKAHHKNCLIIALSKPTINFAAPLIPLRSVKPEEYMSTIRNALEPAI